jgi:hypothetical protein
MFIAGGTEAAADDQTKKLQELSPDSKWKTKRNTTCELTQAAARDL